MKRIDASRYGALLISRPAGREAALSALAELLPSRGQAEVELDFERVISVAPSWLHEFMITLESRGLRTHVRASKNPSVAASLIAIQSHTDAELTAPPSSDRHRFRLCPPGRHWVSRHPRNRSSGRTEDVDGHCRDNPTKRDSLYPEEMRRMFELHRRSATGRPFRTSKPASDQYDELIAFWVQYWNEVLRPRSPLGVDEVKALLLSESSMRPAPPPANAGRAGKARGIAQLTDQAIRILSAQKGEMKDHYVVLTRKDAEDPSIAIPASIRWLFHKQASASRKLGRPADWHEAVAEYKAVLRYYRSEGRTQKLMQRFFEILDGASSQ